MTDKTLGGYIRTTPHPNDMDGGVAAALIGQEADTEFWVRRWKEAADQRDARDSAAQMWKETARRLHQERRAYRADAKYEEARADTLGRAHRECHAQRDEARAELAKADAQIEELNKEAQTYSDALTEEIARAEKAERELDHLATVLETTARQRDEADKRNAHTLTPDAVTDEMVERFRSALHPQQRLAGFLVEAGLRAALTEPPTRRLEAERLDPIIDAAIRGHSDIASPTVVHAIADALAEEGVYVPEVGR